VIFGQHLFGFEEEFLLFPSGSSPALSAAESSPASETQSSLAEAQSEEEAVVFESGWSCGEDDCDGMCCAEVRLTAEFIHVYGTANEDDLRVFEGLNFLYRIENDTDEKLDYDSRYKLCKKEGDKWEWLNKADIFPAVLHFVEPNSSTEQYAVELEGLSAGEYRLVKQVGEHTLWLEFAVKEDYGTIER